MFLGGDFETFVETASPGDRFCYGRGEAPARELVQAMRPFVDSGALVPLRRRDGSGFVFMVERGRGSLPVRARASRGAVRNKRIRKSSLTLVFEALVRAARRGLPCPTNDELAARCHLSGKLAASYRMRCLVQSGHISVVDHSPYGRRVVTILTGAHTGKATREAKL